MVPILKSGVSYGNFGGLESFWRVFPSSETVRGHGVAVLYTEILRRPSLIMMVIYLGKKKKKKKMLKTPNTLYALDWKLSSRA